MLPYYRTNDDFSDTTETGEKFTVLHLEEGFRAGPDKDSERERFEKSTDLTAPAAGTKLGGGGRTRMELHRKYLQAIVEKPEDWDKFPSFEEYCETVETGKEVHFEHEQAE